MNGINLNRNIMSSLPEEVRWNIWTYVSGEPEKNWKPVLRELKITMNNRKCLDMEEACKVCNTVKWSKEMLSVQLFSRPPNKVFYCSAKCLVSHQGKPINNKSLIFAM